MMVVAISQQEIHGNRPNGVNPTRPRGREIPPSMYMSPAPSTTASSSTSTTSSSSSVSRRSPSPSPRVSRVNANASAANRSQSVDRRRFSSPKVAAVANVGEAPAATKLLVTSTRSLSVSFQGEAFSLPISKAKVVNLSNSCRKATPERRRVVPTRGKVDGGGYGEHGENLKAATDPRQRWPARTRELNPVLKTLACRPIADEDTLGSRMPVRSLTDSLFGEAGRASLDGLLRNFEQRNSHNTNSAYASPVPSDLTASDTESVSSGSTSEAHEGSGIARQRSGPGGILVSARFWQETNMRLRRIQDSGSMLSMSPMQKTDAPPKFNQARRFGDGPLTSPRAMLSPIRGAITPSTPGTLMTPSPSRGTSPSKVRTLHASSLNGAFGDTPSVLSFAVDIRRGKVGEKQIIDAYHLRLVYNRHLQWRFANARADVELAVQRRNAEKNLWNAWITITGLCDSIRHKRMLLQLLKQKSKLDFILRGQMTYLEEWSQLDEENYSSLEGAIEALKASTLRLPVVGGAIADVQGVKEAVWSAIDVMQAIASSKCLLPSKVEEVNSIVGELANTAAREQALLEQCHDILSSLTDTQVKQSSLRTQILQLDRLSGGSLTSGDTPGYQSDVDREQNTLRSSGDGYMDRVANRKEATSSI